MKEIEFKLKSKPDEKEQAIIDNFENSFRDLIKKAQGKLNQYVQGAAVTMEDEELYGLLVKSLDNVAVINKYINVDALFNQFDTWETYHDMDQFLLWMQQYISERSGAYGETEFMQDIESNTLSEIIEHCLGEYILTYNAFEESYAELDQEQLRIIVKVLWTLINMIIERNFSYKYTMKVSGELFEWDDRIFDCFWKAIDGNRDALWKIVVMQKISSLANAAEEL